MIGQENTFSDYLHWYNLLCNKVEKQDTLNDEEQIFFRYYRYIVKVALKYYKKEMFEDMIQEGVLWMYKAHKRFWSDGFDRRQINTGGKITEQKYIFRMIFVYMVKYFYNNRFPISMNDYGYNQHFKGKVNFISSKDIPEECLLDIKELEFDSDDTANLIKTIISYLDDGKLQELNSRWKT